MILFFTEKIFAVEFFIKPEIANYNTPDDNLYGFYSDSDFETDYPYMMGTRIGMTFSKMQLSPFSRFVIMANSIFFSFFSIISCSNCFFMRFF